MKVNLTQAQSVLLQGLLTLFLGVVATALTSGYQAFVSGHIDASMLTQFVFNSILIGVGNALRAYIPAHIPQELQALKDTQQQVADGQQHLLDEFSNLTMSRPAIRATGPQPILLKQPTAPTAAIPAFVPPARPATIQATAQPEVAQVPFPVLPQEPTADQGG